jgi:hypothetical protein
MTRKHFEAIANTIYEQVRNVADLLNSEDIDRAEALIRARVLVDMADDMADTLAGMNPRFDARRFLDACGAWQYWTNLIKATGTMPTGC